MVQGHEYSAEVVAVGSAVRKVKPGDRVTGRPQLVCGECNPCKRGQYNVCSNLRVEAFQADGVAQDYFVIPEERVVALPEGMSPDYGAMVEPTAVAAHATSRPRALGGRNVVVSGAGTIGNLVAQFARARGAKRVVITDVSDYRLEKAKECGVDVCVNTKEKNFGEALVEAFGPDKADVIYDCAGNNVTMGQAIQYARKGSVIVLVAVFADMATVDLAVANDHELDIKSTMMYRHEDYVGAIELVEAGKVQLKPLISKIFPFAQYLDAYKYIDANRETTMKVIIAVQEK